MSQPTQIQYRNSTYFGSFQAYQRNGHGLLILDNSTILLANWRKGIIHGKFVLISPSLRGYGTMVNNKLDGYCIVAITGARPGDQNYNKEDAKTLYGMFHQNKLYGKCVIVDSVNVAVHQFVSNQLKETLSKRPIRDRQVYDALIEHFPRNMYTLEEFLMEFMREAAAESAEGQHTPRYQPVVTQYEDGKFYGYEECNGSGRKFGFLMRENEMISIGEHLHARLDGIGRFYLQNGVEDGIFKEGQLKGIGIRYFTHGNKYTLGEHDGVATLQKGYGFPVRQIGQIRKQFHLRSIYFYNDIVMLGINQLLQGILREVAGRRQRAIGDSRQAGRNSRDVNRNPNNRPANRSPLQAKLTKYQIQSDLIQETSPIKDKMVNEYKPIDHRNLKYFTLTKDEQESDKKRYPQGSSSREKSQTMYNVGAKGRAMVVDKPTANSRFSHEPEDNYRKTYQPTTQNTQPIRERSATKGSKSSQVKDTRELVRGMEEEQKRKRLDLDKIYRQAGLYRRK